MEKRQLGKTDMKVTILGFGAAEIGFNELSPAEAGRILNSALDSGLNVIDTAECYRISEELIGKTVGGRRDDYYLFTKCGHMGKDFGMADWDPKMLEKSIDRSLKRLQTDYVDLLQLHSCSEEILKQGDVIEVLQRAKEQGKTRYIGYSGENAAALYAVRCGAFDTLQTSVNIADQLKVDFQLKEAKDRGMGVIAKRPLANVAWRHDSLPDSDYGYEYWKRLKKIGYEFLADREQDISTALRFTLAMPAVATAIAGTSKPERWQQNAAMLEKGPLSEEQVTAIRERFLAFADASWVGQV